MSRLIPGLSLPEVITAETGPILQITQPPQGCVFTVYILEAERGRFVLKIGPSPGRVADLERESRVLTQLQQYRPMVAAPVVAAPEMGMFLFTYLEGVTILEALDQQDRAGKHALIERYGRCLRMVHTWQPEFPLPQDWIGDALRRAAENIHIGGVQDPIAYEDSPFDGYSSRVLIRELEEQHLGIKNEVRFCHGDYCLPNILTQMDEVTGLIDWGLGGYADYRYDLATALWTLRHNLREPEYAQTFLQAYGYTGPQEHLRFFEALYVLV